MKLDINELAYHLSEADMLLFDDVISATAEADESIDSAAILSSVKRKAGIEMKITKSTKKRTITIIIAAAAAALLCGFTGYTIYKYNYGNAFSSRWADNKPIAGNVAELESTTQPAQYEIIKNSFEGIDFTVEGVVSDVGQDIAVITARKADGTPFAQGEGKAFEAGLQMCLPCNAACFDGVDDLSTAKLYWGYMCANVEVNDDGSLSITLANDWKFGSEEYDVILGFGDIFAFESPAQNSENEESFVDFLNSLNSLGGLNVYNEVDAEREYEKKLSAHKQLYNDLAEEVYEGEFILKLHVSDSNFKIPPEETACGLNVTLSGMTCRLFGDGDSFKKFIGQTEEEGSADVTFILDNGESFTASTLYMITPHSRFADEFVMLDDSLPTSTVSLYLDLSRFTDPYSVSEILINGKQLWHK